MFNDLMQKIADLNDHLGLDPADLFLNVPELHDLNDEFYARWKTYEKARKARRDARHG